MKKKLLLALSALMIFGAGQALAAESEQIDSESSQVQVLCCGGYHHSYDYDDHGYCWR